MHGDAADPRRVQQALGYLAALHGGDAARAAQAQAQAERWRARTPANESAWQAAHARWQAVAGLAPQLRADVFPDEALPMVRAARRQWLRRAGSGAGLLGMAAFSGWFGLRHWNHAPTYEARWTTRPREQLPRIPLPDGSVLALAADGALRARFSRRNRDVVLERGHAYFDVARDPQRPWTVQTRLGQVEVLGTAFAVSDRGGDVAVRVERGQVRVRSGDGTRRDLVAGQAVVLHPGGDGSATATLGDVRSFAQGGLSDVAAWREGWWRFTAVPLADVAAEFSAYSARPLHVVPAVAALTLTGSFPIQRPQVLLEALPRALPVRVRPDGDGWRIEPAG